MLVAQTIMNLPAVHKTRAWSLGQEDLLENGVAIHSSILACRIPWTEEPGRLESMGSPRGGHDWATTWLREDVLKLEQLCCETDLQKFFPFANLKLDIHWITFFFSLFPLIITILLSVSTNLTAFRYLSIYICLLWLTFHLA